QRARSHAGARAARALLAPRLLGRVVHGAAILLGARADARVRLECDHNLVYERFVVIAAEHGVVRVQRAAAAAAILADQFEFHDQALGAGCLAAGLAAGFASAFGAALGSAFGAALGACAFTGARWPLAASWTTTSRPLEPGTEPFTSNSWRSASMRTISSLEMVRRALPRCPGMRLPLKTCAGLWFWPVEPGTRWEIELPCEAFCPPKWWRLMTPAKPLPMVTPCTSTFWPTLNISCTPSLAPTFSSAISFSFTLNSRSTRPASTAALAR